MGGFSAVLGNPPFLGGQKLTGTFGDVFRAYIVRNIANGVRGSADLCAYFLLKIEAIINQERGYSGIVYTNTICEGDSKEVGIDQIYPAKMKFYSVLKNQPWTGQASVVVSLISSSRQTIEPVFLNGKPVQKINNRLKEGQEFEWDPKELDLRKGFAYMGDNLYGSGFIVDKEKYQQFITSNPNSALILKEYLNGRSLVNQFPITNDGYVICAEDYDETSLKLKFPEIYQHLESTVKESRKRAKSKKDRDIWWKFTAYRKEMREKIGDLNQVFVRPQSSSTHGLLLSDVRRIHSIKCIIFPTNSWEFFAIYQSTIYERWIWEYSSSLSSTISFSISDCFLTFPMLKLNHVEDLARDYYEERSRILIKHEVGLTGLMNLMSDETNKSFENLKSLQHQLDYSVGQALGVDVCESDYTYIQTKFGKRWSINDHKWEIIHTQLLRLNMEQFNSD